MPEEDDYYNVADFNENFETIDALMAENEALIDEVNEKIGISYEGETVFSLLKSRGNIIKSIQRVTFQMSANTTTGTRTINEVNPEKSFVIFERLHEYTNKSMKIDYTLNATSIDFTHDSFSSGYLPDNLYGLWIIEFC